MKIARAIERADDGQADCFWHDNSMSIRYLIVMQGTTESPTSKSALTDMGQLLGQATRSSKEFTYVSASSPHLMPGEFGPFTVLLVL